MGKVLKFILSGEREPLRLRVCLEQMEDANEIKWISVSVDGGMKAQLKHSLGEGSKVKGRLACLYRNRGMTIGVYVGMLESIVTPIIL